MRQYKITNPVTEDYPYRLLPIKHWVENVLGFFWRKILSKKKSKAVFVVILLVRYIITAGKR